MKLIIFDIDGTLTDTKKVDDKCFIKAFYHVFGIDIKNQNWEDLINVTDWGITEEIIRKKHNRVPTNKEYSEIKNEFIRLLKLEAEKAPSQFKPAKKAQKFFNFL